MLQVKFGIYIVKTTRGHNISGVKDKKRRQTDTQTDIQTDRQIDKQKDRQTDRNFLMFKLISFLIHYMMKYEIYFSNQNFVDMLFYQLFPMVYISWQIRDFREFVHS